jgi:hypothetical protein
VRALGWLAGMAAGILTTGWWQLRDGFARGYDRARFGPPQQRAATRYVLRVPQLCPDPSAHRRAAS